MSKIDVTDLAREELPMAAFPAPRSEAFRLYMSPDVHRGVNAHAKADPAVEICGVLVGQWGRDEHGPFAMATDYIRSTNATSKFAEVTFTHESWAEINREMDTRHADKRIIGWYHSHPDFGIFLSERDCFIHEHFFSGPGQVAYVVDPVRDLEGVFSWQEGKPAPMSHFWVGSQVHTVHASVRSEQRETAAAKMHSPAAGDPHAQAAAFTPPLPSPLGSSTTLLAWMCLFLLGYGCAGWRSQAEQRLLAEGAVAHYGLMKVVKLGLEEDVSQVRRALKSIASDLAKLPKATDELSSEAAAKAEKQRQALGDSLIMAERSLEKIQQDYALTPAERAMYLELQAAKEAELNKLFERRSPSSTSAASNPKAQPAARPPSAEKPETEVRSDAQSPPSSEPRPDADR